MIILILLFLWYSMIFSFSAQNGETSGSLSGSIALKTVQVFDKLTFGHRSEENIALLAKKLEFPIRKAAHFTEYAVLGCLWFFFFRIFLGKAGGKKNRICMLVSVGIGSCPQREMSFTRPLFREEAVILGMCCWTLPAALPGFSYVVSLPAGHANHKH